MEGTDGFYTILGTLVLDDTGDVFEFKSTGTVCDVPESMVGKTACVSGILGVAGTSHLLWETGEICPIPLRLFYRDASGRTVTAF
mgnify:CR=1 FL=1